MSCGFWTRTESNCIAPQSDCIANYLSIQFLMAVHHQHKVISIKWTELFLLVTGKYLGDGSTTPDVLAFNRGHSWSAICLWWWIISNRSFLAWTMNQTTKNCSINTFADQKCDNIIKVPKLKLKLSYCVDDYVSHFIWCVPLSGLLCDDNEWPDRKTLKPRNEFHQVKCHTG